LIIKQENALLVLIKRNQMIFRCFVYQFKIQTLIIVTYIKTNQIVKIV